MSIGVIVGKKMKLLQNCAYTLSAVAQLPLLFAAIYIKTWTLDMAESDGCARQPSHLCFVNINQPTDRIRVAA